ncbi:MAG: glycosyltransferase family 2 protein [Schwartzia sp.]|nr:glycosyltransferase family 2 protein [Schwartzia sp. (in: firmicutes)]
MGNQFQKSASSPSLVACYLVKDEADELRLSLDSVKDFVDDIFIIMTEKNDAVDAMLRDFGTELNSFSKRDTGLTIRYFPWCDDFAAARNFALDLVDDCAPDSDWIIFLDADEFFSPRTRQNLPQLAVKATSAPIDLIALPIDNVDGKGADAPLLLRSFGSRLLRTSAGIRYEGAIHESPMMPDGSFPRSATVTANELLIIHTGYRSSVSEKKARRNLSILKDRLAACQKDRDEAEAAGDKQGVQLAELLAWQLYGYFAETYEGLHDYAAAMNFAEADLDVRRSIPELASNGTFSSRSARVLIRCLNHFPQRLTDRLKVTETATLLFPQVPEFWADRAVALRAAGDVQMAVAYGERAMAAWQEYKKNPDSCTEPVMFDEELAKRLRDDINSWRAES